ncbi:FlaD/FlaE family flagellar protein [Methanococcus aeolicus]|jgi:flagellar protein FlaD|nr:FlaD/FlaE family flagellar protein [Methanococcus aeolicus]
MPPNMEDYLTEDEVEEYLDGLNTKIPTFMVELLRKNLRDKKLNKDQLDRIVDRVFNIYMGKKPEDKKIKELNNKLNELSSKLDALLKLATISSATKISSELEEELNEKGQGKDGEIDVQDAILSDSEHIAINSDDADRVDESSDKNMVLGNEKDLSIVRSKNKVQGTYKLESLSEDPLSTVLAFKWIEFLAGRVGINNLMNMLDYYHDLKWISEDVVARLIKISKTMEYLTEENNKIDEVVNKMVPEDHIVSILYVEKLAGRTISADELEHIDREVSKIKQWVNELQNI